MTVLLGVAAIFRPAAGNLLTYLALFAANSALSLGGWEWYRQWPSLKLLKGVTLTLAVVLDTLALYYTGGGLNVFMFLYFFSVSAAGLLTGFAGSMWTALLSVGGLIWLEVQRAGMLQPSARMVIFIYGLNLVLTAALASYLFAWFRDREAKHKATLGELKQIRLDTQSILDSVSAGVLVVNADRGVLYSNPSCRMLLGLPADAHTAQIESCLQPGRPLGDVLARAGEYANGEFNPRINGEHERVLGYTLSPLPDVQGNVRGHVLLLADLTPMKAAERADRERERLAAVGMLSRDLAHEIRNPLATVRGCVEMMRSVGNDAQERNRFLDLALKESDRLNNLLRDFLTFAKLEPVRKEHLDLAEFVRRRLPGKASSLKLIDHLPPSLTAEYDPEQLGLIIDAVLLSLVEWAEGDGEVQLESGRNGHQAIRFLLKGKTIPEETRSAVFQPFSGVNRASFGLALPTALRAVHAHGGSLTLNSEPGIGTWFELKL